MIKGMRKKKIIIAVVLMSIILALAGGYIWKMRKQAVTAILKVLPDEIDLRVKDLKYQELEVGGVKWEVQADNASLQKKDKLALFEKIRIRFIMKDGRVYHLSGDQGRMNTESHDMDITGNIVIVSDKGERFRTDRLQFSKKDELIFTNGPVLMENDFMSVKAVGMSLSMRDEQLTLHSTVKAQIGQVK